MHYRVTAPTRDVLHRHSEHAACLAETLTLIFDLEFQYHAIYTYMYNNSMSVGLKDIVETNEQTDRQTVPIALPSRLTWLVAVDY